MSSRPLPIFLDAHSVGNPLDWRPLSREDAHRLASRGLLVVVVAVHPGGASRFDDHSPYWQATGPYVYASLRYFTPTGFGASTPGAAAGRPASARKAAPKEAGDQEEYEPLEDTEPAPPPTAPAPAPAARAPAPASAPLAKTELRFDLAMDPATPGLEDDVFVLSSGDGTYNQVRTVKDDKVPGDRKLTLVFPGVTEGKAYTLSQVQDGEETVLVSSVTASSSKPASPSNSGEVVGCKAAFRECRILGEALDINKPEEPRYPFELTFAKDKWVYVFGGPSGGAVSLLAEGRGTGDGGFCPVDLKTHGGKNLRPYHSKASAWLTLPLKVNGKEWDLYACLSPIQLPWKRIVMLEKSPQRRCYRIGDSTGGASWVPGHIGREVPKLSKAQDSRIADPGKDIVMIGLVDHMAEARRRAKVFQRELQPYLENRFDTPVDTSRITEEQKIRRRKKHVAGLIKALLEQHPKKKQFADCLAQKGGQLDQFLREENEREIKLKKRFSAAAKSLVKWMDSPERTFQEVLVDYFADPKVPELWEIAEEDIAFLTAYFDVSDLTRLFGKRMVETQDSWVMDWLLNKDRYPAIRKPTQAMVEIISWLTGVVIRTEKSTEMLFSIYSAWVPELEFRKDKVTFYSGEIHSSQSKETHWFPDNRKPRPNQSEKSNFKILATPESDVVYDRVRVNLECQAWKKLEKISESKVLQGLMVGLEVNNTYLATRSFLTEEWNATGVVNLTGSVVDLIGASLEMATKFGAQIGRGFLGRIVFVSSVCDIIVAVLEARREYKERDYDQMAAQIGIAIGSATMGVGATLVVTSICGSFFSVSGFFTIGAGLSMTGAGSVPGALCFLIGAVIFAGSAFASAVLFRDEFQEWLSECPFGSMPQWSIGAANASEKMGGDLDLRMNWG